MVSRALFESVGGFDEELAIAGNDIDLCLRLSQLGYRSIWTPYCRVTHRESVSRESESVVPDETRMWRRWSRAFSAGDPYFNPNFAQDRSDCEIDWGRLDEILERGQVA
jgi:GT2 family glycosyltransferase